MHPWFKENPVGITVCDLEGIIIDMNEKSAQIFQKYGGLSLLGKSLFDCHQAHSQAKIREIMETGVSNSYTIQKNGLKKIIHQCPWYQEGKIAGLIEYSIEIPEDMPHFVRN